MSTIIQPTRILIIQTAFIGDVILATSIIEKLHQYFPQAQLDFLLRKGNEGLLEGHPYLHEVLIWIKKEDKYRNLFDTITQVRAGKYDLVFNLQRFFSTGLITVLSGAKRTIGFDKNPLSFLFSEKIKHQIQFGTHETDRNHQLIVQLTDDHKAPMRLHPSPQDEEQVNGYKPQPYVCLAPTSVWFTKQLPPHKWTELIQRFPKDWKVYLLGAPADKDACETIIHKSGCTNAINLSGRLNFLESAALMRDAQMNYVNDSAPLHIASAMNAPTTAFFCSTVPAFGFGPLAKQSTIIETTQKLDCRPCGLHGYKACPKGHFKCAESIDIKSLSLPAKQSPTGSD